MLTFYNEHHAQHRGRFEMFRGEMTPCFEKPERAELVVAELARRGLGKIVTPHGVPLVSLERIHTPRYLHFLRSAWSDWLALDPANAGKDAFPSVWPIRSLRDDIEPDNFTARMGLYSMDSGTPLTAGTWIAAKTGADCAVNAAHALRLGERGTFALTRPPGHHAGADFFGGYCFLNNAALAAQHLLDDGAQTRRHPRHRLPPRQRHPEHFLRPRRRAVHLDPCRPAHRIPVLPGPCRRNRRRRRRSAAT